MSQFRVEKLLNQLSMDDTVMYFGYGSNLSLENFKRFKHISPLSVERGIIRDYKLSFSLCYPSKGYANIHYSTGSNVHGVILKLKKTDLFNKLAKMELSYRIISMKAYTYDDFSEVNVYTFIFDKICEKRIKNEIKNNPLKKQVIRIFDINGKKPEQNYLETIIRGAKQLKLNTKYIKMLENINYIPILTFNPTNKQLNKINNKIWKMNDIKYINKNANKFISIFKGIVFDMANFPPSWKYIAKGRDITLMYAARCAYANKNNCLSIESIENKQKLYINGEVQNFLNGVYGIKILGKMDSVHYKYAFDSYDW